MALPHMLAKPEYMAMIYLIYFNAAIMIRVTYQFPWPFPWDASSATAIHRSQRAPSQVDAKVFYAEAGLEIRGEWRTADGSTGSVTGTKALAGLALGGAVTCGDWWVNPADFMEKPGKNLGKR